MNRKKVIDKLTGEFVTNLNKLPDEGLKALAEGKLVLKLDKAVGGESGGSFTLTYQATVSPSSGTTAPSFGFPTSTKP
jgi:hypothetical protein